MSYTPLMLAVKDENVELTRKLLDDPKTDIKAVNDKNWTAMMYALFKRNVPIIQMLIEKGDIFTEEQILRVRERDNLWEAAYLGKEDRVVFFIETMKMNPNEKKNGYTPLMQASQRGHLSIVRYLIEKAGADPDEGSDEEGNTALMLACKKNVSTVVQYLVSLPNVVVDKRNRRGWTALMFASRRGSYECVLILLRTNRVDVNAQDFEFLNTCVMHACRYGYRNVVETLVNHGADIEIPDHLGYTCLMRSVQYKHNNVLEYLLLLGASLYKKTRSMVSVDKILEKSDNREAYEMIRAHLIKEMNS